jgi:hypothetical protein
VVASLTARQIELEVTKGNNIVGTCQSQGVESEDPLKSERMKRVARSNSTEAVSKEVVGTER